MTRYELNPVTGRYRVARTTRPPSRRWPLEPLLVATRRPVPHLEQLARLPSGIGRRWATHGLTDEAADRVAVGLGMHPLEVWPDWC